MDWVVAVSPEEAAGRALAPATEKAACAAFDQHGCVLLRGAFPVATIEAMRREYVRQFGMLDLAAMGAEAAKPPPNRFLQVGGARYDITVRMVDAFGTPDAFANPLLVKLLGSLLGEDLRLSNFTLVVAHPGAPQQHAHRDHGHLFSRPGVGPNLPVYAVNVAVPLIDVDIPTGPTAVWLGSHRAEKDSTLVEATACAWQRGDCVLMDYRTRHAGLANMSDRARPIMYMVYACPWFFDDVNHINRISLDMPIEHYEALPASVRPLLIRAYSYATRARWHEVELAGGRAAERDLANASNHPKAGRNDPCPCGSGKKFKHCHGRGA
jgi:hypothetical protein